MIEILLVFAFLSYLGAFINKQRRNVLGCGLIGYSGQQDYNIDKIKFLMLWNSIERGKDATGVYTPTCGLMKDNEPASKFFYQKIAKPWVEDNQLIAHVRAKTVGSNIARNAHPFDKENIVLAHNGTLVDIVELADKYDMKFADYNVDSEVLATGINRAFGEDVTLDNLKVESLSEYKGAAALLIYSKHLDMIFVFKDKERPLFYGYDLDGGMYISSIEEALKAVDVFEIKAFENNTLHAIDHGKIVKTWKYEVYCEIHKNVYNGKVRGREQGQKFPKLKKDQKGIDILTKDTKSYHFLGLWLKANTQTWSSYKNSFGKFAEMKIGKYYRVSGYYDENAPWIEVKDENGNYGCASVRSFDFEDCIPQEGDLYEITYPLVTKKDQVKLWDKGEKAIVCSYLIEDGLIELWNERLGSSWNIPTSSCRPCGIDATLEYWSSQNKEKENLNQDDSIQGAEIITEDSPFIEETKVTPLGDYIATPIYLGVLDIIENGLSSLEEVFNDNQDITPQLNAIRMDIDNSKDKTYLDCLLVEN